MQLPWQSRSSYDGVLKTIINDWQVNGVFAAFSGQPFTVTASGTAVNTPSNPQTADLDGTFNVLGNIGAAGKWFDTSALCAADRRSFRQQRAATSSTVLAATTSTSRCSGRSRSAVSRKARVPNGSRQHLEPSGLRQSAGKHHVRHVRAGPRHADRIRSVRSGWVSGSPSDLDVTLG